MKTNEQIVMNSNGWQAVNRIGILNENYHTLILNYNELISEITRLESASDPFLLLFNNTNLNRYIFNFLASTSALTDSCRNVMKYYEGSNIFSNYKFYINQTFAQNTSFVFIKDLRNFQMHYKIMFPCLSSENHLSYDVHELLQYKKWTKLSEDYINNQSGFVILRPLFQNYFRALEPFYNNIYSQLIEFHKQDFKETAKLAQEINMLIPNFYNKFI